MYIAVKRGKWNNGILDNVFLQHSFEGNLRENFENFESGHLVSSGPQTRKEFFLPTEKRSIGSVSRCTRSPNKPFGLIDLLLKLPKSEFGLRELKPPLFPAGIALNREFGFIERFPIGDRRPGIALNKEFGFIDLVKRLPERAPKRELGLRTFFFPRTAKNVGLSSGLARFKAIMSWNHDTYVEQ